jgi:cysteinyl-tRNA synthetase, unknown class
MWNRVGAALVAGLMFVSGSAQLRAAEGGAALLSNVKSWAYQLKDISPEKIQAIKSSPYDMVIIDSSMFPEDKEIRLTREQVDSMKAKPDGSRRVVIAYFSAGEAENFRYYWQAGWNRNPPEWIYRPSKEWKGDFTVRYWFPAWQKIVFGSPDALIDRILEAGFDGVMIDRTDAYYYFGDTAEHRKYMVQFVKKMSDYMRAKNPNVAIIAQNAEELLEHKDYFDSIDAVLKEDLVYGIRHNETRNDKEEVRHSGDLLDNAKTKGKKIFTVEYLKDPKAIQAVRDFHRQHGFVLYVGKKRDLFDLDGVIGE